MIDNMIEYSNYFIGTRYVWGGNNPEEGFDCSGYVHEVLKSVGKAPPSRLSSSALYEWLKSQGLKSGTPKKGSILFFGKPNGIEHVALSLDGIRMNEAAGEGKESTTKGMVRRRLITNRKDLVASIDLRW